jgi:IclR family transcriptional regulator, KDG regulon repressor
MKKNKESPRYNIHVLDKCFDMLGIIARHPSGITLVDLSKEIKLPKSSVFRYLYTCEEHGYVERLLDGERFRLGIKLFELGQVFYNSIDIRELALPSMRYLLETFQETVNLAVRDGTEIVYIEILESSQALRMAAQVGSRDDLHSTALGKAIMAHMKPTDAEEIISKIKFHKRTEHTIMDVDTLRNELIAVRKRGYSIDFMENEDGVCCTGAPILNHKGVPVAAMSVSGPLSRIEAEKLTKIGIEIANRARLVSKKLGY